jgi:hypothetical protein
MIRVRPQGRRARLVVWGGVTTVPRIVASPESTPAVRGNERSGRALKACSRLSQPDIWFQLAKMRLTTLS